MRAPLPQSDRRFSVEQAGRKALTGTATKTVLIVEDNEVERDGLSVVLRRRGFQVTEAANMVQALESLRAGTPDLILLDMFISEGGDGWTFMERLKRSPQWSALPVILVTGMSIASQEWATALGARTVVRKPIDVDELLAKINQHCP